MSLNELRIAAAHGMRLTSRIARGAATLLDAASERVLGGALRQQLQFQAVASAMDLHDMTLNAEEAYYADAYWAWIEPRLPSASGGNWIDAGCGSGRLTLPLARSVGRRHQSVVGVDVHKEALESARIEARTHGITNVQFVNREIAEYLCGLETNSILGALFIEVGFFMTDLDSALGELFRVLSPGGVLFATIRPTWFMVALDSARGNWDAVEIELTTHSGVLPGWGSWQNWSTRAESETLFRRHGFQIEGCIGIGTLSGIEGDPLARLNNPSTLGPRAINLLSIAERQLGESGTDSSRYMLFAARKPKSHIDPTKTSAR